MAGMSGSLPKRWEAPVLLLVVAISAGWFVVNPQAHPIIYLVIYGAEFLALLWADRATARPSLPAFLAGALLAVGISIPVAWRYWRPDNLQRQLEMYEARAADLRRDSIPSPPTASLVALRIVVIDDRTGLHIPDAKIWVDEFGIALDSDSQGKATFRVPAHHSIIRIRVSKDGYQPIDHDITVYPEAPAVRVRLPATSRPSGTGGMP